MVVRRYRWRTFLSRVTLGEKGQIVKRNKPKTSLQLVWRLGETEWLLAYKQPERIRRQIKRPPSNVIQLRFPEMGGDPADQVL
jgi:hypothetical protein